MLVPGILPVTFSRVVTEQSKRGEIYLSLWFRGILVHHGGSSPFIPILGSHPTRLELPTPGGLHCNLSIAFTASYMALPGSPQRESTPAAHCLSQRLDPNCNVAVPPALCNLQNQHHWEEAKFCCPFKEQPGALVP